MSNKILSMSLAEQKYRLVERVGRRFLILASLNERNYMLFIEAEDTNPTVHFDGKGYEFVRPITEKQTPDLYIIADDADALRQLG